MAIKLIEELRATFEYHPDGYLIRKKNGKPCGRRANTRQGYAQVKVNGRNLRAHRVIYAIVHGEIPEGEIDHINGNRMDNRIENLREVSSSENAHNSKKPKTNTSGFPGVYWNTRDQKWVARIRVNYRQIFLGYFDDLNEAVEARKKAKIKYHPTSPEAQRFANEGVDLIKKGDTE